MNSQDWMAVFLTLKLSLLSTALLLLLGTPLAWWMAHSKFRFKYIAEAIVALPLVLPPTVLGFYLLVGFGSKSPLGTLFSELGLGSLAFSFTGLVLGSMIYSLPFVVQPIRDAFLSVGTKPLEAAASLGASPWDRFWTVVFPLARPGFLTATVLGFAHTVGEFGVVLMIGGNIPGETQVLSIAIYEHVEAMEYVQAHWLSGGLLFCSALLLLFIYRSNHKNKGRLL